MDVSRWPPAEILQAGQVYAWVRSEPYRRRDGSETELLVYQSECVRCGAPFEVMTSTSGHRWLNRRCPKHHRPGSKA